MAGKYNDLQVHMKKANPLIYYVPFAGHSRDLVGVNQHHHNYHHHINQQTTCLLFLLLLFF